MNCTIKIEREGVMCPVGTLSDDGFRYGNAYLKDLNAHPISVSLPLRENPFSPEEAKCFFDGLLPEGFTRKSVADWMHASEDDYMSILAGLGRECLGALMVSIENEKIDSGYHKLSIDDVKALASEGATQSAKIVVQSHLSLAGATGKVGLYYDEETGCWYQPYGTAPSTHIVKQSHVRLRDMVLNELLCMTTARGCGIEVPECFAVNPGRNFDENILLASKRYDRFFAPKGKSYNGLPVPYRLHQEDFSQAMGFSASNKYEPQDGKYLLQMYELLRQWSSNPLEDQLKLWDRTVYNFLIGNTDNHLKNSSLLYNSDLSGMRLAPAYDILSTTVYDSCTRHLSMHIGKAKTLDEVTIDDFCIAAKEIGLSEKIALKHYNAIVDVFEDRLTKATKELDDAGFVNAKKIKSQILKTGGYGRLK